MQNLSRYRVLELFAQGLVDLDADDADLAALIAKIKRQAKKALNYKPPLRNAKLAEARVKARASTMRKAKEFRTVIMPLIKEAQKEGCESTRQIAEWLNKAGHSTARGFNWSSASVHRVINGEDAQ
jgi:ribosomal protein L17